MVQKYETPDLSNLELDKEQFEKEGKFDPIAVLRERDIIPEKFSIDEKGKEQIDDAEIKYIFHFLRDHIKEGSVLNLGSGSAHVHQMCAIEDKLTHVTAIDISAKHNQVVKELLEGAQRIGQQKLVQELDIKTLKILANALSKDENYGISKNGDEIISSVYQKSLYKGKLDVITADMLEKVDELKTGELVDNRKYDNAVLLFAIFMRSKEELLKFFQSVKARLDEGGKIILIEPEEYSGPDLEVGHVSLEEDEIVVKRYGDYRDLSLEEFKEVMSKAGFKNIYSETHEVSGDSVDEKECFKGYMSIVAEK